MFQRLNGDRQPKFPFFTRITRGKKPSGSSPAQAGCLVFNLLGETNEVQIFVPLRINRVSTLDIKIDGSLKVKRHTLVFISYEH